MQGPAPRAKDPTLMDPRIASLLAALRDVALILFAVVYTIHTL